MKTLLKAIGWFFLLLIAIPVVWLGSGFAYETWATYVHRFRLTIEVETPDGLKIGSGVMQSAWSRKAGWVPQTGGVISSLRGDAVFVDLGNGQNVIAILGMGSTGSQDGIARLAASAFGRDKPLWFIDAPHWTGSAELNPAYIPTLVAFANLNDPAFQEQAETQGLLAAWSDGAAWTAQVAREREELATLWAADPWLNTSGQ